MGSFLLFTRALFSRFHFIKDQRNFFLNQDRDNTFSLLGSPFYHFRRALTSIKKKINPFKNQPQPQAPDKIYTPPLSIKLYNKTKNHISLTKRLQSLLYSYKKGVGVRV